MSAFQEDAVSSAVVDAARTDSLTASFATRRVGPPAERQRAFARAKQRSGRIRLLKLAILIAGFAAAAAALAAAFFNPFSTKLGSLGLSNLSVEGTNIVMERPRLAGFRSDGQPYLLTADRALQDIKQPKMVQLQKVDGEIGLAGGEATHLRADQGVYDSMAEHMALSGNVRIKNGSFTVLLRSANFDFKSGVYGSDDPVEVRAGDGTTIFADRATALNHGQELSFEGHVRTTIVPQHPAAETNKD